MKKYPYTKIEKCDDGYRFFIYPTNNNHQPIGRSVSAYPTFDTCISALNKFKAWVVENNLKCDDGHLVKIKKGHRSSLNEGEGVTVYGFFYETDDGVSIFESRMRYDHKESCKNGIKLVYLAILHGENRE